MSICISALLPRQPTEVIDEDRFKSSEQNKTYADDVMFYMSLSGTWTCDKRLHVMVPEPKSYRHSLSPQFLLLPVSYDPWEVHNLVVIFRFGEVFLAHNSRHNLLMGT